jgi:hypothetical protein
LTPRLLDVSSRGISGLPLDVSSTCSATGTACGPSAVTAPNDEN